MARSCHDVRYARTLPYTASTVVQNPTVWRYAADNLSKWGASRLILGYLPGALKRFSPPSEQGTTFRESIMAQHKNKPQLRTEEQLAEDTLAELARQIREHVEEYDCDGLAQTFIETMTLGSEVIADIVLADWEDRQDVFTLTPQEHARKRAELERKCLLDTLELAYERLQGATSGCAQLLCDALKPFMILQGRFPEDWCKAPKVEPELAARQVPKS